jgi:hypothetical protein
VGLFRKFGGHLLRIFEKRREKLKRRRERDEPKTGDLRVAAIVRGLAQDHQVPFYRGAPSGPDRSWKGATPQSLIDAVHDEHPSWEFADILAEARRRFESGAAPS